ncbi:MAG TPA: hypothetical protein VMU32_08910 [Solirubrobacteraceae bacterium]|nr:hypothetical protein [Solirubrobacteraceae bacterium]
MSGEQLTGAAQGNGLAGQGNGLAAAATCAGCGAPLVADQRYCLACGEPASPVRLAFLDVLQAEHRPAPAGGTPAPPGGGVYAAYSQAAEPDGLLGALRRYSGLLALVGVLLASLLIGLLVGHWASGGGSGGGKQVVEVKIPGGLVAAAPAAGSGGAGTSGAGSSGAGSGAASNRSTGGAKAGGASGAHGAASSAKTESAAEEAKAEKEVAAATAPPPVKRKASSGTLQKLEHSTGKQHEKEVSKLISGDEPIETH